MTDDSAVPGHGTTHDTIHDTPHGAHHDPHASGDRRDVMGLDPIDWPVWLVGLAGVGAGALTALCFALAVGYVG